MELPRALLLLALPLAAQAAHLAKRRPSPDVAPDSDTAAWPPSWPRRGHSEDALSGALVDSFLNPDNVRALTNVQASLLPPADSGNPAIGFSACMRPFCKQFLMALKALAAQRILDTLHEPGAKKIDVYALLDWNCLKMFQNTAKQFPAMKRVLNIQAIPLPRLAPLQLSRDLFKRCASARFYFPKLFPNRTVLYLDSDVLPVGPLQSIFDTMENNSRTPLFMTEEVDGANCNQCGWYHEQEAATRYGRVRVHAGANGLNSGVLGINARAWHSMRLDDRVADVLKEVAAGKIKLVLGDQDLLNYLARKDNATAHALPCEYNVRPGCGCRNKDGFRTPMVLHGNHGVFDTGVWGHARDALNSAAHSVLRGARPAGKTTLWEMTQLHIVSLLR